MHFACTALLHCPNASHPMPLTWSSLLEQRGQFIVSLPVWCIRWKKLFINSCDEFNGKLDHILKQSHKHPESFISCKRGQVVCDTEKMSHCHPHSYLEWENTWISLLNTTVWKKCFNRKEQLTVHHCQQLLHRVLLQNAINTSVMQVKGIVSNSKQRSLLQLNYVNDVCNIRGGIFVK